MSQNKIQTGKTGERIARKILLNNGYSIIETNFRSYFGEIDIICRHGATLVFVEIKCRTSILYGNPYDCINRKKINKIIKTGNIYLHNHRLYDMPVRIDVVSIITSTCGELISYEILRNVSEVF